MAALTFPRRVTSTSSTITVDSGGLPAWIPNAGEFASVSLSNGSVIDPNVIDPLYAGTDLWRGSSGGWSTVWASGYGGGIYAPTLGTYGSLLLCNGGHNTWWGNGVVRYDIADRVWSHHTYPIYAANQHSIVGGVVTDTDSLDSDSVNDRVGLAGHYIKYADGTPIAGAEVTGNSTTNWQPVPLHTNCGISFIPQDAGGGTLGSLVFLGHDQTGLRVLSANGRVFRLDLETNIWSAIPYAFNQSSSVPGCEYDSLNKVLWIFTANSGVKAHSYLIGTTRTLSTSAGLNMSADYCNACFMASRSLLIMATRNNSGTSPVIRAFNVAGYVHGTTTTIPSYTLNIAAWPTGWPPSLHKGNLGGKDKLEYCEQDGNVYYLNTASGTNTTCTLYKLQPPAVGQEQAGTWTWVPETINLMSGDTFGSFVGTNPSEEPTWGGKTRFVPSLKSLFVTAKHNTPVQAIRSINWT